MVVENDQMYSPHQLYDALYADADADAETPVFLTEGHEMRR